MSSKMMSQVIYSPEEVQRKYVNLMRFLDKNYPEGGYPQEYEDILVELESALDQIEGDSKW